MKLRVLFSFLALMTFIAVKAQIVSVGLIGPAQPGGWDVDTNMIQDAVDTNLWSLDILLANGDAKFRANDAWDVNWGFTDFPIGVGTQNGPNIPVRAGMTHVTFNSATGAYYFSVASDIGILGSAAPFGWDSDVNMYQDTGDATQYSLSLKLVSGEAKFRLNDDWTTNWGATDFPSGVGTQNGPNIPIAVGGTYTVLFNKGTGAYSFQLTSFSTVGIIGDATPGGATPTPMTQGANPDSWSVNAVLTSGGVQFDGDNGTAVWGGTDFPAGTATLGGPPIAVPAGRYLIAFNSETLGYIFTPVTYYHPVSIIGSATPGGWDTDSDMELNPLIPDSSEWYLRIVLIDGELKFRANHDWTVNWGAGTFPSGIAIQDGPNVPVTAGEYKIYFNSFTGQYGFVLLKVFSSMGLIGPATPAGDWTTDAPMEKDANDENLWKIQSINLTDGEAKFRAEGAWTTNWGNTDWPSGTGIQDGPNIPITAGTYGVILNSDSGDYAFGDPLTATTELLNPSSILAYPNPANDILNVDISAVDLKGELKLSVFDINGKLVRSDVQQAQPLMQVHVASLLPGFYTLQISNDKYIIGKKFVIAR